MNLFSLIVSICSVVLSALAFLKAKSAFAMAKTVIDRINESEDALRIHNLIATLNAAKEAAMRREGGATAHRSVGYTRNRDIQFLRDAQDALRTKLPISWDDDQCSRANNAADDIETALNAINQAGAARDGWKDARATIQTIVPHFEREERYLKNSALIPITT